LNFLNTEIKEIIDIYEITEDEFLDIKNNLIAKELYSLSASHIKNNTVLILELSKDNNLTTKMVNLTKKQISNVTKGLMESLSKYCIAKQFYQSFKQKYFIKAFPIAMEDGKIKLSVINNDKAILYNFLMERRSLNISSINKIKNKKFFTKNNIIYISIVNYNSSTLEVLCSQLSKKVVKSIFLEALGFLSRRLSKSYELQKVNTIIDMKFRSVIFNCYFTNDKKIDGIFQSYLHHILEEKIGNIKININYRKKIV